MSDNMSATARKEDDVVKVDSHTESIGCDGGGGPLGHPKVYYEPGPDGRVQCGYCGRTFAKSPGSDNPEV